MNISEMERATGIPKQTIRFYEKEGLISPKRNAENQYREYDEQDIRLLKQICVLRKVGLPILEIKRVLNQEITMAEAISTRRMEILEEKEEQEMLLKLCDDLKVQSIEYMDADRYVEKMQKQGKKKKRIRKLYEEYTQIYQSEEKKEFSFYPDNLIYTAKEFTNELIRYAESIGAEITITKESMSPEFVLNGVEYSAMRTSCRFGMIVHCRMLHPELAEPNNVLGKKKRILQQIAKLGPVIFIGLFIMLMHITDLTTHPILAILMAISLAVVLVASLIPYWNMKD